MEGNPEGQGYVGELKRRYEQAERSSDIRTIRYHEQIARGTDMNQVTVLGGADEERS